MVDDLSIVTLVYQGVIIFHILVPAKSSSRSPSPAKSCRESARHRPLYPSSFVLPAYLFRLCAWAVEMLWNADVSAADAIGIAQFMAVYVGKMVMNMIKHCWILGKYDPFPSKPSQQLNGILPEWDGFVPWKSPLCCRHVLDRCCTSPTYTQILT